jgi:hypothetical protein
MTKTKRSYKKKSYKTKRSYKKKSYKTKRSYKKGGSEEECCICEKKIEDKKSFTPSGCLMKHGKIRSHKICEKCWWDSFAQEWVNHKCPGCTKNKPLHGSPPPKIIDLTED